MLFVLQAAKFGQQPQQLALPDWLLKDGDGTPITEVAPRPEPLSGPRSEPSLVSYQNSNQSPSQNLDKDRNQTPS